MCLAIILKNLQNNYGDIPYLYIIIPHDSMFVVIQGL